MVTMEILALMLAGVVMLCMCAPGIVVLMALAWSTWPAVLGTVVCWCVGADEYVQWVWYVMGLVALLRCCAGAMRRCEVAS